MDNAVYNLTFITPTRNPHNMVSYGWVNAMADRDIASVNGWELLSIVKVRDIG